MSTQYDTVQGKYMEAQRSYLETRQDHGRAFIRRHLPESANGLRLLDLGCGHGPDLAAYEAIGADVWGIDESEFMIGEAKKVARKPEQMLTGRIQQMPFPDAYFDILIGRFSLHYLEDVSAAFLQFHRVLRPGGKVVVTVGHPIIEFLLQTEKVYGLRQIVSMPLYGGQVVVAYPSHTVSDYLSPAFLRHFDLIDFFEYVAEQRIPNMWTPNGLCIAALRR